MKVTEDKVQGVVSVGGIGVRVTSEACPSLVWPRAWNNFRDFKVWIVALSG